MKPKSAFLLLTLVFLLTGCTSGRVSVTKSELDNTTYIAMTPATSMRYVGLGLSWNDKLHKDEIVLEVQKTHGGIIAPGESLHFNVDGAMYKFRSIDEVPQQGYESAVIHGPIYIPGYAWSSRRYIVSPAFLKKVVAAKKAVMRVDLDREFVEGVLVQDATFFISAAPDFLNALENYLEKGIVAEDSTTSRKIVSDYETDRSRWE